MRSIQKRTECCGAGKVPITPKRRVRSWRRGRRCSREGEGFRARSLSLRPLFSIQTERPGAIDEHLQEPARHAHVLVEVDKLARVTKIAVGYKRGRDAPDGQHQSRGLPMPSD